MRLGEYALVTCVVPARNLHDEPGLGMLHTGDQFFYVRMIEYTPPAEDGSFNERTGTCDRANASRQLDFLAARKEVAVGLFVRGRFKLAAYRNRRIHELLGYIT